MRVLTSLYGIRSVPILVKGLIARLYLHSTSIILLEVFLYIFQLIELQSYCSLSKSTSGSWSCIIQCICEAISWEILTSERVNFIVKFNIQP